MPTGWFIVQPPLSGAQTVTLKKVSPSLAGAQLHDGSIASFAPKKVAFSMAGLMQPAGPMNVALKKLAVSMSGEEQTFGGLAVALPKVAHDFEQELTLGGIASTLMPAKLAFAIQTQGVIGTTLSTATATLGGLQDYQGALAARLAVAQAIIAGAHGQDGTAAVTLPKVHAQAFGAPELVSVDSASGAVTTTRTLTSRSMAAALPLREGDMIIHWANIVSGAVAATAEPAGWVNILGPGVVLGGPGGAPVRLVAFYHIVTAGEAGVMTSFTLTNIMDVNGTGRQWTMVIRGADPVNPIDSAAGISVNPSAANLTLPSLTPTKSGCLMLYFFGPDDVAKSLGTAPAGFTEAVRNSGAAGSTSGAVGYWPTLSEAGVLVAGPVYTWSSDESNGVSLAIAPRTS